MKYDWMVGYLYIGMKLVCMRTLWLVGETWIRYG